MVEKKQYPSQINSKTISARIPVQDYVNILNESISLGISLNDFLLRKIYANNANLNLNNEDSEIVNSVFNFINNYNFKTLELSDKEEYWVENNNLNIFKNPIHCDKLLTVHLEGENFFTIQELIEKITFLNNQNIKADLSNVIMQLTILIQNKFSNPNDRKTYRKELFELLKELQ